MRRTDIPQKMYELDTENALLSLRSIQKIM
jgi:hypothetical protein